MLRETHKKFRGDFRKKFVLKYGEQLEFVKSLAAGPKTVGAIAPTSARMARKMASVINVDSGLPVLELGPGTGVITKAILEAGVKPENIVSIEYSSSFLPGLRRHYPGVNFVQGDAFKLSNIVRELGIEKFDCVISALPLLNFPITQRIRLVNSALEIIEPGRPMVQFSYSPRPPVPRRSRHFSVRHLDTVIRNIPPARIWTYQRPQGY